MNKNNEILFGMILQTKGDKDDLRTGIELLKARFPRLVVTGIERNDFGAYAGGWRAYISFNVIVEELDADHMDKTRGVHAPPKHIRALKKHTKFHGGGCFEYEYGEDE